MHMTDGFVRDLVQCGGPFGCRLCSQTVRRWLRGCRRLECRLCGDSLEPRRASADLWCDCGLAGARPGRELAVLGSLHAVKAVGGKSIKTGTEGDLP